MNNNKGGKEKVKKNEGTNENEPFFKNIPACLEVEHHL